jgi:hypothetical protein
MYFSIVKVVAHAIKSEPKLHLVNYVYDSHIPDVHAHANKSQYIVGVTISLTFDAFRP